MSIQAESILPAELDQMGWDALFAVEQANGNFEMPSQEATLAAFIAKTRVNCNYRCRYPCYEDLDNEAGLPDVMPLKVAKQTGYRMGEYASRCGITELVLGIHGGEPLFIQHAGEYYDELIPSLRQSAAEEKSDLHISVSMHTNGSMLRPRVLDVLRKNGVAISVSLDGGQKAHDRQRLTTSGKGTFALTEKGMQYLLDDRYRDMYSGILAVVDLRNDSLQVYRDLLKFDPPKLDFLLPHATWDNPPRVPEGITGETPWADWLLQIFHVWFSDKLAHPKTTLDIRMFRSIMEMAYLGQSSTELVGPYAGNEVIIRTDGSIELLDSLRIAGEGMQRIGMNVFDSSFEGVAAHMRRRGMLGLKTLAAECQRCELQQICGGGGIPHQFKNGSFDNPSVYSPDLRKLITVIADTTERRLREDILKKRATAAGNIAVTSAAATPAR